MRSSNNDLRKTNMMNPNAAIASVSRQALWNTGTMDHNLSEQETQSCLIECVVLAPVASHKIHRIAERDTL